MVDLYRSAHAVCAVAALLLLSAGPVCAQRGPGGGGGPGGGPRPGGDTGGGPVAVAEVTERSHAIVVTGRLEPRTRIVHRVPSAGFVDEVFVAPGRRVAAGDPLLTIRRRDDVLELYQPVPLEARIAGSVSEVHVRPQAEVSSGDEAVTILGTDGYVLVANVSDKDAFRVDIGQRVTGRTTEGRSVTGVLQTRSQEPDYETGLFELTFAFAAGAGTRIGEFVLIELPIDRVQGVFVPRDAVVRRYGSFFLWTVSEEDTLVAREVVPGDTFDDAIHVAEGLEPGDRFLRVVTGREREGAPVGGNGQTGDR